MLIMFRPEKTVPERKGPVSFDGVTFMPGLNREVAEDAWAKIKDQAVVKQYLEWKALEVINQGQQQEVTKPPDNSDAPPTDPNAVNDLDGMNVEDAQKLIEEVDNVALLEEWLQKEQRKTLVNAINRRITEIKEGRA